MSTLIERPQRFTGFGPSILVRTLRGRRRVSPIPPGRLAARQMLREQCPTRPGVYGWLDANGQLVYVGKSKSLRGRLLSYFAKTPTDHKMVRIRQASESLVWEPVANELLALIREQELIYRWRPAFNSQGQPHRLKPAFVCLSNSPAPNAYLARQISPRVEQAFGPIAGTRRLQWAIESLNHEFQLRDCADKTGFEFNDQLHLFDNLSTAQCIRYELGTCPAPCAGFCSAHDYQQRVDRLVRFLTGQDRTLLDQLKSNMRTAAGQQAFERAASIRDRLDHLSWLDRRLQGLRMGFTKLNGVLPVLNRKNRVAWLVLRQGRLLQTIAQPTRQADRAKTTRGTLIQVAQGPAELPASRLEISLQLIILSWFRNHPQDLRKIIGFQQAIEACQVSLPEAVQPPGEREKRSDWLEFSQN
ncbi:MAG: UvrB/UvrC motif-containing protein [Mariniblastus sp.]|nr:UvrB/UvrC motif-containing protein [Mariniblastus sp.]